jgi:hypothetical protein
MSSGSLTDNYLSILVIICRVLEIERPGAIVFEQPHIRCYQQVLEDQTPEFCQATGKLIIYNQ